tara:strand:+ start:3370 stop:3726 length:357 start_codon:yes stop_codon:yes gene_type:complete
MTGLEAMLRDMADNIAPLHSDYPDGRKFVMDENPDALGSENKWLENGTSYIWRVGVLAQWDSNKCDYARLFIGHERSPDQHEFIGFLHWHDGENDDIARCMKRYLELAAVTHPVFDPA